MNLMRTHNDFISKPEVQFWIPILVFLASAISMYFGIKADTTVLRHDMDSIKGSVETNYSKIEQNREISDKKFGIISRTLNIDLDR